MNDLAKLDKEILLKRDALRWPLRAKVVLQNYRLTAQDLQRYQATGRNSSRAQILNVSLEGVEELSVLLHLEGLSKPLRLGHQQRQEMAAIFQSQNFADWIGQTLTLTISKSSYHDKTSNHIELSIAANNPNSQYTSLEMHPATSRTGETGQISSGRLYSASAPRNTPIWHTSANTVSNRTVSNRTVTDSTVTDSTVTDNDVTEREAATSDTATDYLSATAQASWTGGTPHVHFSGAGQEHSLSDPSTNAALGYNRPTRSFFQPSWLKDIGQMAMVKELRLLLGPNLIIAFVIFLLIIAVIHFERIANLAALLLP